MKLRSRLAAFGLLWLGFAGSAQAGQTHVAVAANFTEPVRQIAPLFRQKTGHEAVLIFGASGAFFTQITHNAPFEVFLSADDGRPFGGSLCRSPVPDFCRERSWASRISSGISVWS